jgi:hypothetical protein
MCVFDAILNATVPSFIVKLFLENHVAMSICHRSKVIRLFRLPLKMPSENLGERIVPQTNFFFDEISLKAPPWVNPRAMRYMV